MRLPHFRPPPHRTYGFVRAWALTAPIRAAPGLRGSSEFRIPSSAFGRVSRLSQPRPGSDADGLGASRWRAPAIRNPHSAMEESFVRRPLSSLRPALSSPGVARPSPEIVRATPCRRYRRLAACQTRSSFRRCVSWALSRLRMDECIWLTRLSERSSVAPISFIVISS